MPMILYWYTTIFFAVQVIASIAKVYQKFTGGYSEVPKSTQIEERLTIPFHLVSFVAIYVYLRNEMVLSSLFRQGYVITSLLLQIASFWLPKQQFIRTKLSGNTHILANVAAVLPLVPLYYMLIDYAFFSSPFK